MKGKELKIMHLESLIINSKRGSTENQTGTTWTVELFLDKPNFFMVFQSFIAYKYKCNEILLLWLRYSNIILTHPHQIYFEIAQAMCESNPHNPILSF